MWEFTADMLITNWNKSLFGCKCIAKRIFDQWFDLFIRGNHECSPGRILQPVHLDLCTCCHHLHAAGRSLFCGVHRCYTACSHVHQHGEFALRETQLNAFKSCVCSIFYMLICLCSASVLPLWWRTLIRWTLAKHWWTTPCTLPGLVHRSWKGSG